MCTCMHMVSHVRSFVTPCTVAPQAPMSMEFSSQEYWSGLPFPPLGDFPNPGIEPASLALAGRFFTSSTNWGILMTQNWIFINIFFRTFKKVFKILELNLFQNWIFLSIRNLFLGDLSMPLWLLSFLWQKGEGLCSLKFLNGRLSLNDHDSCLFLKE